MKPRDLDDLDNRYRQQAGWTAGLRGSLFARLGWSQLRRVLEVGCGTGAVLSTLEHGPHAFGIDLDLVPLSIARRNAAQAHLAQADGLRLPFPSDAFDLTYCHFLLLWMPDPLHALREMSRVTRSGGTVLALAEPDYSARIDHPPELHILGSLQADALRRQGADPETGRKLSGLFHAAGLQDVETGVLGGQWAGPPPWPEWESEWSTLRSDLESTLPAVELDRLQALDAHAWQDGRRVLFVPTFYALGRCV